MYFGKFVPSFPLSISVKTHIEINHVTIKSFWYANDMAVGEETSGAKMGGYLFSCIDEKPLTPLQQYTQSSS